MMHNDSSKGRAGQGRLKIGVPRELRQHATNHHIERSVRECRQHVLGGTLVELDLNARHCLLHQSERAGHDFQHHKRQDTDPQERAAVGGRAELVLNAA